MSIATMILGESGTGKSTSLRNLDAASTLLIQAIRKPLPFRSSNWRRCTKEDPAGSILVNDNAAFIEEAMRRTRRDVVVIDDFQYVLANEFMRRSDEKGFDKFTDIGRHAWNILMAATQLAEHQRVYILAHTASDDIGRTRMKTIGKMLDEKITPEGLFSIVMRTVVRDGSYFFATQNNGSDTTKTPMGLFSEQLIDNDLAAVDAAICDYYQLTTTA